MTPQREEAARLLRLARRDAVAMTALLDAPEVPLAIALFHAQQSVEKVLKAIMCLHALDYRRTHDLEELAARLADVGQTCNVPVIDMRRLTPYAVEYRYDDEAPHLLQPEHARAIVATIFDWGDDQMRSAIA